MCDRVAQRFVAGLRDKVRHAANDLRHGAAEFPRADAADAGAKQRAVGFLEAGLHELGRPGLAHHPRAPLELLLALATPARQHARIHGDGVAIERLLLVGELAQQLHFVVDLAGRLTQIFRQRRAHILMVDFGSVDVAVVVDLQRPVAIVFQPFLQPPAMAREFFGFVLVGFKALFARRQNFRVRRSRLLRVGHQIHFPCLAQNGILSSGFSPGASNGFCSFFFGGSGGHARPLPYTRRPVGQT